MAIIQTIEEKKQIFLSNSLVIFITIISILNVHILDVLKCLFLYHLMFTTNINT